MPRSEQLTLQQFREHLNADRSMDAYAWPGGYPLFYLCIDGECLCPECATKNFTLIEVAIMDQDSSDWHVVAVGANWEDPALMCANCNKRIPSAYAEDEAAKTKEA